MEPITIYNFYNKLFGKEFLQWDSQTRFEAAKDKLGKNLSLDVHSMLEAMVALQVTESPWKDYSIFEVIVWALNGYTPRIDIIEKPPSYFIAYALYIMNALRKETFSDEVKQYIAAVLAEEGFIYAPPPLDIAQDYLNKFVEDKQEIPKIEEAWKKYQTTNKNLEEITINPLNSLLDAQLSKLIVNELYTRRKEALLKKELV